MKSGTAEGQSDMPASKNRRTLILLRHLQILRGIGILIPTLMLGKEVHALAEKSLIRKDLKSNFVRRPLNLLEQKKPSTTSLRNSL